MYRTPDEYGTFAIFPAVKGKHIDEIIFIIDFLKLNVYR